MKKILFLSSALIMTMCSAFAEDAATTDKKITGGAGTCTVDVLGVSDNNATANTIATWSLNSYDCAAGQYLDETTLECTECPVGSYCPGGTFTVEANNSKTACPADYTSDAAATAESECYMGCELACTQQTCPPHSNNCTHVASSTTGRQYFGGICDAITSSCEMNFNCDTGYNKQELTAETISQSLLSVFGGSSDMNVLPIYCMATGNVDVSGLNSCEIVSPGTYSTILMDMRNGIAPILYRVTFQVAYNTISPFTYPGVYTKTYTDNDTPTTDKTHTIALIPADVNIESTDEFLYMYYKLTDVGFATAETYELMLQGYGTWEEFFNSESLSIETFPFDKILQSFNVTTITDKPWIAVEGFAFGSKLTTPVKMSDMIQDEMDGGLYFLGHVSNELTTRAIPNVYTNINYTACGPNLININWNDANSINTKNMCYYDGAITLPSDPVKPGYTFMGWKLVDGTTTE